MRVTQILKSLNKQNLNKNSATYFKITFYRILTIAPSLTNQLWNISKFVLENLSVVVKANKNCPMTEETHAKLVQRLSIAECQPHLNKLVSRCASKLDLMADDE